MFTSVWVFVIKNFPSSIFTYIRKAVKTRKKSKISFHLNEEEFEGKNRLESRLKYSHISYLCLMINLFIFKYIINTSILIRFFIHFLRSSPFATEFSFSSILWCNVYASKCSTEEEVDGKHLRKMHALGMLVE